MPLSSSNTFRPFHNPIPAGRAALASAAVAALALTGASPGLASSGDAGSASPSESGAVGPSTIQVSHETVSDTAVTAVQVVTLVTGDRVRVTTMSDNSVVAAILPGSPHYGATVKTVRTPSGVYVMPQLPADQQSLFDVSMFDVSALAKLSGDAVPVTLTFAKGVQPHAVPGLSTDAGTTRRAADGTTVVAARYSTSTAGFANSAADAWRGVSSVALPAGAPKARPTGQRMHTLTIKVRNLHGGPVRYEVGFVQNVDNARVLTTQVEIVNGVGTISVPEGNYAVFAGSFRRVLVNPDFPVTADTSVTMRLSDATVRPTEAVPHYGLVDTGVTVSRESDRGGAFVQLLSSDRFVFLVQPVKSTLPHGTLHSTVSATLTPTSELAAGGSGCSTGAAACTAKGFKTLAYTKDFRSGVPATMSFMHPKSDFAIVPQKFYANGPAGIRTADALAFAPFDFISFGTELPVRVPSVRTIWLQGSARLRWMQDYQPTPGYFRDKTATLTKFSGYSPGAAQPVVFAHGPLGPGIEAAYDKDRLGPFCLFCRRGHDLHGFMPLFSGAGTAMSGLLWSPDMGSWTLKGGGDVLASGTGLIAPQVTLPAGRRTYTLQAVSHPDLRSWQLSTNVSDVWTFTSGFGNTVIPLLMPSYVPRVALDGSLSAGSTKFPLDFGNIGSVDARVTHASVELSTDGGRNWTRATVTRVDKNSFAVTYPNPHASDARGYLSLRVSGVDSAGRKVTETAMNVYSLVP